VSGGSLAGAFLESKIDIGAAERDDLRRHLAHLANVIATRGSLDLVRYIPIAIGGIAVAVDVAVAILGRFAPLTRVALLLIGFVTLGLILSTRNRPLVASIRSKIVARTPHVPSGRTTRHVYCTTELTSGLPFYFCGDAVFSVRYGRGHNPLDLAAVASCSAAFPVAFRPFVVNGGRFGFRAVASPRRLAFSDGGVANNLATQWNDDSAAGLIEGIGTLTDATLVMDASAPMAQWRVGWPRGLLSELRTFVRQTGILYNNTVVPRSDTLLRAALDSTADRTTAVAPLVASPVDIARGAFAADGSVRARRILELLASDAAELETSARVSASTKTTLSKLGVESTARLIQHGYAMAMASTGHWPFSRPPDSLPSLADIRQLVQSGS